MLNKTIHPTTLTGIKRLAKSLKIEQAIPHTRALDVAAQQAGFQNFRHARNTLPRTVKHKTFLENHHVYLTVYWKNEKNGSSGRETLHLPLSTPWNSLIEPSQFKLIRTLMWFKAEGSDHLASEHLQQNQSLARRDICAVARTLQFMDATKLRPSRSHHRAFPNSSWSDKLPARDHYSVWYDRKTKRYLFADEPYEQAANTQIHERETWAKRHGFIISKPNWPGMYAPDVGSRLYLVADNEKGIPLKPVVKVLNKLPSPIVEDTWNGESAPMLPYFVSPGTTKVRVRDDTRAIPRSR